MTRSLLSRTLKRNWMQHARWLIALGLLAALVPLTLKYWYETERILALVPGSGGIDLGFFVRWTHSWFSGLNIYTFTDKPQGYPPASMVLLYPFAGWLPMEQARWLWAITT